MSIDFVILTSTYLAIFFVFYLAFIKWGGSRYGLLFLLSVVSRLIVVTWISIDPPSALIEHAGTLFAKGFIFPDELYYFYQAKGAGILLLDYGNPYERVVAIYASLFSYFGSDPIVGRLNNALITSITSVVIYDTIKKTCSDRALRFGFYLAAFSPVLLLFSVTYLKEAMLVFGVALYVNTLLPSRDQDNRKGVVKIGLLSISIFIILWFRWELMVCLVPPLLIKATIRNEAIKKKLYSAIIGAGIVGIFILILFPDAFFGESGQFDIVGQSMDYAGRHKNVISTPFFDVISQWSGPLRVLGFTFLLFISPIITNVLGMIPGLGNPTWLVFATSAHAINWWFCLPFLMAGVFSAIRKRQLIITMFAASLFSWMIISASFRFGGGYDAVRYRDALLPLIITFSVIGIDMLKDKNYNTFLYSALIKGYFVFVVAILITRSIRYVGVA